MEPSTYSERFTIACNHSREPARRGSWCQLGVVPGLVYLGASAGKISWRSPLCNSMLRYCTNVIMAKVLGAVL